MATLAADYYSAPSGGVIAAGRYQRPAWRMAMPAGTWAEVPGNKLSDINPENNPAINPNYPGSAPWRANSGFAAIISAWCGACWDEASCNLWLPLQGGHADYAGNEPYKLSLRQDAPAFSMLRNPTGAVGNTGTLNDGQEATGVYFDGRHRAIHSYNKPVYVPGYGPLIAVQGNTSYTAGGGTNNSLLLNEGTGEMSVLATLASPGAATSGGAACYDQSRGRVYWIGVGTGKLSYLNPASGAWTTLTGGESNLESGNQSLIYVPTIDRIVQLNANLSGGMAVWHPITGARTLPGTTGSGGIALAGNIGAAWCDALGCILCWHNSTNTTLITTLTPPSSAPETNAWTLGTLAVDAGNSVTPTACQSNGTFGRFFVSQKLGAAFVLNAVNQPLYAFALE